MELPARLDGEVTLSAMTITLPRMVSVLASSSMIFFFVVFSIVLCNVFSPLVIGAAYVYYARHASPTLTIGIQGPVLTITKGKQSVEHALDQVVDASVRLTGGTVTIDRALIARQGNLTLTMRDGQKQTYGGLMVHLDGEGPTHQEYQWVCEAIKTFAKDAQPLGTAQDVPEQLRELSQAARPEPETDA